MKKYNSVQTDITGRASQKNRILNQMSLLLKNNSTQNRQWSYNILSAVIEGTADAIFVKDIDGRYIMVNFACTRFLNLSADEIIGKKDCDLYPPETTSQFQEQDSKVLSSGKTHVFEGIASGSDVEQTYLVTKSVYRDNNGKITGLIGISHDITERKKSEEQRIALIKEQEIRLAAVEANRLKDEFLATLSHELRNPLSAILGWVCLLQSKDMDAEARNRALAVIERNARAQGQLIGDLLDVSRVINGHKPLNLHEIDIVSVIEAAVESIKLTANTKQIELETNFGDEPVFIIGDSNRLQQVIWNLLVNAIKFTPEYGRITLSLKRIATNVEVSVTDTGQGIEPEFLPFVFERFRQANMQIPQLHGGLGLGLAIVRHFVELHGGFVKAESKGKGKGARFAVTIPLITSAPEKNLEKRRIRIEEVGENAAIVQPDLTGITVLVVDDDDDTVKMIEAALASCNAKVVATSSVSEAFKIITEKKPDVIVSEIKLKEENGYSLIKKVKAISSVNGREIPAIAFTTLSRECDRINAFLAGFQVHVSKPVNPLELIVIIARLTGKLE